MAEHGEWNRKGATLSGVTALKEFGVNQAFIVKGIRAGKLEYRDGSIWGNPYLKVLRRQLEQYIAEELGADYLSSRRNQTELRKIKKEIADLKKRQDELQTRRTEIEEAIEKSPTRTEVQAPKPKRGAVPARGVRMKTISRAVYQTLFRIYDKHRRKHRENSDSKQMCCMWSTHNPPDIIEGTSPFRDIEDAFHISIDDDEALNLYDMHLDKAAKRIVKIMESGESRNGS